MNKNFNFKRRNKPLLKYSTLAIASIASSLIVLPTLAGEIEVADNDNLTALEFTTVDLDDLSFNVCDADQPCTTSEVLPPKLLEIAQGEHKTFTDQITSSSVTLISISIEPESKLANFSNGKLTALNFNTVALDDLNFKLCDANKPCMTSEILPPRLLEIAQAEDKVFSAQITSSPVNLTPTKIQSESKSVNSLEDNPLDLAQISTKASDLLPNPDQTPFSFSPIDQLQIVAQDSAEPTEEEQEDEREKEAREKKAKILWAALSQFNNSPFVFGTSGTVVDNFRNNTQLFGDWGGVRGEMAKRGIFLDIYSTTVPQGVVSGGNSGGTSVKQNVDVYLNLSTDLLGWWKGGFFHFGLQSKFGSNLIDEAGTLSPLNYANVWPVVEIGDYIAPTEYYLIQELGKNVEFAVGKGNLTNFADTNAFANSYRYQFQNASLSNNLMLGVYAPPSTWVGGIIWEVTPWLTSISAVLDPNGAADNFADNFFKDVAVAQELDFSYKIGQKPGNFRIGFAWDSRDETDFSDPLKVNANGIIDFKDPIRTVNNAYMFFANFDQYLYLVDEAQLDPKEKFLTPRGLGIFGRFGIGPEKSNLINTFGSVGLGAKGIIPGRRYDQFGIGWYYLNFTEGTIDLLREIEDELGVTGVSFNNEQGIEAYYSFAITPALQVTLSAQYIIDPFLSNSDNVFVLGGRTQISF